MPPSRECKAWIDGAWQVRLLAVHPAMQGRGIARALLEDAERRAQVAGATDISLHARRGIRSQAKFYPAAEYFGDTVGDITSLPFRKAIAKLKHNSNEWFRLSIVDGLRQILPCRPSTRADVSFRPWTMSAGRSALYLEIALEDNLPRAILLHKMQRRTAAHV